MGLLSEQSTGGSSFADGVEFEETFPELSVETADPFAHVGQNPVAADTRASAAELEAQLDRRLRDAEARVKATIEEMLNEWQMRFERRLDQRRHDDEQAAAKRRADEDERLRAWRNELETALSARFAERHAAERAQLPDRNGEVRVSLRDTIASAPSARDVGRLVRDLVTEITHTTTFALAVHHATSDEVAYRYRVAADSELGLLLKGEVLDDAPQSPAAHNDGWLRAHRTVRLSGRNVSVHTAQLALRADEKMVGVLTLQSEGDAIADSLLARIADAAHSAAPRLATLRDSGSLRGA